MRRKRKGVSNVRGDEGGSKKRISRRNVAEEWKELTEGNWSISRRRRMHSLSSVAGESESPLLFLPSRASSNISLPASTHRPGRSLFSFQASRTAARVSLIQFLHLPSSVFVSNLFFLSSVAFLFVSPFPFCAK